MKKSTAIVIIILVAALVFGLCGVLMNQLLNPAANSYALTTKVVELNRENDVVVCENFNGNLWEFYGCEDWQLGDIASLLMDDNGTSTIYDDEIVSARYNGTFEGWN